MSISPNQNEGMLAPSKANTMLALSAIEPRLAAEMIPTVTPVTVEKQSAALVNMNVFSKRGRSTPKTGRPWVTE
jgi:hypothetical protein